MTLFQLMQEGTRSLENQDIEEAVIDAKYLLLYVCNITYAEYFLKKDEAATQQEEDEYRRLIYKRGTHIPIQHLIGCQEFMGFPFLVNKDVLIPRQDTECLVEEAIKDSEGKKVLDLCTGSGCIAISIFLLGKPTCVTGVDISEKALTVARANAEKLQADITWIQSDLFCRVEGKYDMIVSNPPYIRTKDIQTLMPEVKEHEPLLALDGKENGLYFYQKIIEEAKTYLTEEGRLYFEIGYDQAEDVKEQMIKNHYTDVKILKDLAGLNRMITGKLRKV